MKIILSIILSGLFILPALSQKSILTNELDSLSYSLGIALGSSINKAGIKEMNEKTFLQGITDVIGGKELVLTAETANGVINDYLTRLNEKQAVINLLEGQKYLAENGKKQGVVTLPSGLQYKIIKEGEGNSPVDTSVVTVYYKGTFIDGKEFDSTEEGNPVKFPVNAVIPGWTEALQLMKSGANWLLYIPSKLAYGENAPAEIGPNKVLIFDVQLLSFE
jgi:FKBP-type peptidyl-prolyl cis-trans isomerase FklB